MAQQSQRYEDLTLAEKMKIIQYLAIFPAITLMVFTRRKLGYRMLKPSRLITMAFILMFINALTNDLPFIRPAGILFAKFPLILLVCGFYQRYRRWRELCNGERWHTFSSGVSYLELLPLPSILTDHRRIYRFVEPFACFVLSIFVGYFLSTALARWIVFSSFAMFIFEQTVFEKQLDRDLDILDGLVAAQVQAETVDHFSGSQSDEGRRTLEDTAGIPTGVAFDIHRQIEKRRAQQAVRPEKFTPEPARQYVQVNVVAAPNLERLPPPAPDNIVRDAPDNPA